MTRSLKIVFAVLVIEYIGWLFFGHPSGAAQFALLGAMVVIAIRYCLDRASDNYKRKVDQICEEADIDKSRYSTD